MISAFSPETLPAPRDLARKLVLFHRNFTGFTGGHLKVWHYFSHVLSSPAHDARIAFTTESKWDNTNPWFPVARQQAPWEPHKADILFLAGLDWRGLPEEDRPDFPKPIINLIQHPRHADKDSELRGFLRNRAIRICVSEEVAADIQATGEVNGPVLTIPNGIDLSASAQKPFEERTIDLLICGMKAPELARKLARSIKAPKRKVQCLTEQMPRSEYLARISDARVAVFLPRPVEGFYLPALEGMACGAVVVCPDCEGNRGFCIDGTNCFRPPQDEEEIRAATLRALALSEMEQDEMQEHARKTVQQHSLESERASFLNILERVDELWKA